MKPTRKTAAKPKAAEPAKKPDPRRRVVTVLIALALLAASYGAGRLQGALALRAAASGWQQEKARLSSSLDANVKALAAVKSRQSLWQLNAGLSEVLADIADKNFGLARDAAREMSALLSRARIDMDPSAAERLQPLVDLISDTARAADALDPETRAKATQARALVVDVLAEQAAPQPGGPASPAASHGAAAPGGQGP
jgi:hypothetical protein